jgi:hypothetical protein
MISINVLLTTIGRPTLKNLMMPSLVNQLNENDYLTIVSDINHDFVSECINSFDFKCKVNHIKNEIQLGYWSHPSRTKYQNSLLGDFIMNADDDDRYVDGAFDMIRNTTVDKDTIYLYKVQWDDNFSWRTKGLIEIGWIGTACGVIPNTHDLPEWAIDGYDADGRFYQDLCKNRKVEFIDYVIYKVRDTK